MDEKENKKEPESKHEEQHEEQHEKKGATFDMYHFFSRKDVILAIILILALLIYLLFALTSGPEAV